MSFLLMTISFLGLFGCEPEKSALDQLIAKIESLKPHESLSVSGQYEVTERVPETETFARVTFVRGTALYGGERAERFHLDLEEWISRWDGGAAPYSRDSAIIAFDGRVGAKFRRFTGSAERVVRLGRGLIGANTPIEGAGVGMALSGLEFSLLYRLNSELNLKNYLRGPGATVVEVTRDGRRCFEVNLQADLRRVTLILDCEDGLRLCEERTEYDGEPRQTLVVSEFFPAKNGIAHPKVAKLTRFVDGQPHEITEYRASTIEIDDPAVGPKSFCIEWPDWCPVTDLVTSTVFAMAPIDEKLRDDFDAQFDRIAKAFTEMERTLPVPRTAGVRRIRDTATKIVSSEHTPDPASAVISALLPEIEGRRADNCSLNTVAFLMDYYGQPYDLEALSQQLGIGESRELVTSLLSVKNVLVANGLEVSSYKNTAAAEIIDFSRDHPIAFHVRYREDLPAHYLVAMGGDEKGTYIVDPLHGEGYLTRDEFDQRFGRALTGLCLAVQPQRFGALTLEPNLGVHTVDMGNLDEGNLYYQVEVPLLNLTDDPVRILKSTGSCNCFKGVTPHVLPPNDETIVTFTFKSGTFGVGQVSKTVALKLDDEDVKTVNLDFQARVNPLPLERKITWFPATVRFGPSSGSKQSSTSASFVVPRGVSLDVAKSQTEFVLVEPVSRGHVSGLDPRDLVRYRLTLLTDDTPEFVELSVSAGSQKIIQVPVSGGRTLKTAIPGVPTMVEGGSR